MNARRMTLTLSVAATLTAGAGGALPAPAGAYATVAPPPNQSSATGLPDGRVHEQVSPANKHGFQAGGYALISVREEHVYGYSLASADGNAVSFGSFGPAAEVNPSGSNLEFVAQRSAAGWRSRATMPRGFNNKDTGVAGQKPFWFDFSSDLSHLVFDLSYPDVAGAPNFSFANLYLEGPDPFVEPAWLARPVGAESKLGKSFKPISLLGGSPDLSTVYFAYNQEESLISGINPGPGTPGWALYEYRDGVLSYAGVLPDGSIDPGGAVGIEMGSRSSSGGYSPAESGNPVSRDGSRLFFISPGPIGDHFTGTPELYVHETEADGTQRAVLASGSQLPGHVGEPAPSGIGTLAVTAPAARELASKPHDWHEEFGPLSAYASPDGSHVFFKSPDRLTEEAPAGGGVYDFDVGTGVLEYVAAPGLAGIVTVAGDGSSFVFEDNAVSPTELDRWSAGPHGGTVSPIVQLPPVIDPNTGEEWCDGIACVGPAHLLDNNSVLVFSAEAPIAGFNDAGEYMQIFRYDFKSNELSCVSCPPAGVKPSGTAEISSVDEYFNKGSNSPLLGQVVTDDRGVSADGSRVFFDSPDALLPRAVNGLRNVYEWENGSLFLISSGTSSDKSFYLDSSESGGDVFFTTTEGLVQGDNDGGYDVYDARIPRPGDNPPPASVPCQGDVCQGPPSVPSLLGLPPSATFNGLGNPAPEPAAKPVVKPKPKSKAKGCKKGYVKKRGRCVKKAKAKRAANNRRASS
jgi:hypothetical protein